MRALERENYTGTRNTPYSGGFVTRHYGRPAERVHALQIEINRTLYMNEDEIRRGDDLPLLKRRIGTLIDALGAIDEARLAA